jgi:hypothetical protein
MAYDMKTDYQALINSTTDPGLRNQYETSRNEKIAAMNNAGTNTGGYTPTYTYSGTDPVAGTPSGGTSGGTTGGRDIAQEIINMLTSGGPIDYARLNTLTAERDAKIASNPSLYSQFESTQTILDRYLPLAKENETLQSQLNQQNNKPQTQIDSITSLLQSLASSTPSYMSYDQANSQAAAELGPQYANAATTLRNSLDLDAEKRGIYNSALGAGIMAENQGKLSNEQVSATAARANEIMQQDRTTALQEKQLQSDTLSKLLSSLMGYQVDVSGLTGTYNGQDTLAKGELTGTLNGQSTLASKQLEIQKALQEAEITGTYNGQQTLDARKLAADTLNNQITQALQTVESLGYVPNQTIASILGVPVGTQSAQAKQAAASLQATIRGQNISAAGTAASNSVANFSKDMAIWEATGVAPDTPAMKYYGIAAGTPWNSQAGMTAKQQLEEMTAQEEIDHINQSTNLMKQLGIDRNTAEAVALITGQASDFSKASTIVNSQSAALTAEGINTTSLLSALKSYYAQSAAPGLVAGGYNPNTGSGTAVNGMASGGGYNYGGKSYSLKPITNNAYIQILNQQKYTDGQAFQYRGPYFVGTFVHQGGKWYTLS